LSILDLERMTPAQLQRREAEEQREFKDSLRNGAGRRDWSC
jgi:hypothetical protein